MTSPTCLNQPSVLSHLKCLFRFLSYGPQLLSWSSQGKTSSVITIASTRKGGQRQWNLSHPSRCDLNPFAPPLLLAPEPHVWSERMTPPLPLLFWYGLHSSSTETKQVQLRLMGWIGSLSSLCLQNTSVYPTYTLSPEASAQLRTRSARLRVFTFWLNPI